MVASIQNFAVFISLISALCNAQPAPPTALSVTSSKSNELTISWTDSATSGATHKVYVGTAAASEANAVAASSPFTTTSTTGASPTPLVGNTEYNVAVYAVDATDSTLVSATLTQTGTTVFVAPTLNPPTNPTSSSIDLSWTAPAIGGGAATITSYTITYIGGGGGTQDVTDPSATSATIILLGSNTAYSFTIAAKSSAGTGDSSTAQSGTTLFAAPTLNPPTNPTSSSIDLSWTASAIGGNGASITSYTITYTGGSGGTQDVTDPSATSATISPLDSNTAYSFTIAAKSSIGTGDSSTAQPGTTLFAAPTLNPPTNPTSSSIDLSWTAPGNGGGAVSITGYTISYTGGSGGTQDVTVPSATSAIITPLDSNTAYRFAIAAISSAGTGDSSTAQSRTTLPDQVVLAANTTTATINTIGLNWNPVSGGVPVTYTVTWIPATGGSSSISNNSASVSGLTASTQYTFNVVAVNSAGSSADSGPYNSQYSTLPDAPAAPSLLPGSDATNMIVVSWTAPTGGNDIIDYVVEWTANSATATKVVPVPTTSTTLTSLTPGELYSVNVKARNSAGAGRKSPITSNRTMFAAPTLNPPTNPTSSSIDLSWTAPGNGGGAVTVTGYTISYTGGGGGTQDVTDPSATSATITPLDSNTAYSFTIAAKSSTGTGDSSTAQSGTTLPDQVVLAANTTTATINTIRLIWIPVSGGVPVTYTVTWIPATGGSPMTGISANSTSVSGLTASTQYTFNVVAVNSAGSSVDSGPYNSQYSTLPDAPAVPSLSPGSDATNTIVVSWTAPTGGNDIIDYVVEWTANSATATKVATGTSTTLNSLTPGELYSVNVKARNSARAGAKSNNNLYRTNPPIPMDVTLMQPTFKNTTILIVSWTMPATYFVVSFYVITLTPSSGDPDGTHTVTYPATTTSPTTYTLGGLTPAQSYVANVQAVSNDTAGELSDTSRSLSTSACPFECEGCIGPCSLSSTGGCDCSCIDGYFPTQLDCQPVVCKEETLVHPTLLINVTFPSLQGGFQSSSLETCDNQTVNGGKPYGTRSCLLNGTSTTPVWLTSCDRGIQNIANVTITSTEDRVAVANDLEVLTSNPESLSPDDVTNTVQALDNVLDVPSITQEVSSSAVAVLSNMLNVPDDVFVASTESYSLLTATESVGTKVELDENGVYEAVTSNVGIAAIQPAVSGRTSFGVDNLPTNSDLGFRSDQVHLFGSGAPDNVTGSISVPNSAAFTNLGTSERISFLAFSNDKVFITPNGTYDDVNSVVVLSAAVGQISVTNLNEPVIVQLRTNVTLNNGSDGRSSSCVFWDEDIQSWTNGDVDSKVEETSDSVVCHFNHLTNFATLLARDDTGIVNTKALDIVSIVGSSISSFCLLLTILSFVCVPKLRSGGKFRGAVLLVNFSMALLLLNLLLIFSEQSFVYSSPDSCLAVGVLLHFSLLASFAWMTVEAVNLCLVIVTPLYNHAHVNEKTVFIVSHIWGWFVPSLFVAITCGVDLNLYRRSDEECWIQTDMVLYIVLVPMIIVLTFNFIAYVAVLVASVSANRIRKKSSNPGSVKQQVVMSVTLFVLLGITWVFGFGISGTGDSAVVFGYIFAVLNSLQGSFIFCLFIVRNKATRMEIQIQVGKEIATVHRTIEDSTSQYQMESPRSGTQ